VTQLELIARSSVLGFSCFLKQGLISLYNEAEVEEDACENYRKKQILPSFLYSLD